MIHTWGRWKYFACFKKFVLTCIGHFSKASWWTSMSVPQTTSLMSQTRQTRVSTWHMTQRSSSVFHTSCPSSSQTQSMHMRLVGEFFSVLICICLTSQPVRVHELARDRKDSLLDLSFFLHSKHICVSLVSKWLGEFFAETVLPFTQ